MKYVPTKNMFQIWHNAEERKAFEDAAHEEAKDSFIIGLKNDGYKNIEEYKDYLRGYSSADLFHDALDYRKERYQEDDLANHPDITPEQSFRRMVSCFEHTINIDIHNEIIEELERLGQ